MSERGHALGVIRTRDPIRRHMGLTCVFVCITLLDVAEGLFDLDLLDDEDPLEIDVQVAHLFKHPYLGIDDIQDVWGQ